MCVIVNGNEIVLTGTVGDDWWGDGFSPSEVVSALATVGRSTDIIVRLNSGGGIATDGAAIHAAFAAHRGKVTMIVEGIAASAASLIAMAADHLSMSLGSVMMIHDPAVVTWGDVAVHTKAIEYLDSLGASYADVYAEKTGKPVDEMRALMKAETWMTAAEAVAAGFADEVGSAANDNAPPEPTAFAYRAYAHAPSALVALADARGWKPPHHPKPAAAKAVIVPPARSEDPDMTDTRTREELISELEAAKAAAPKLKAEAAKRIKDITSAEAAAGREALAAHLAYETDMTVEAAVATLAAAAKVGDDAAASYAAGRAAASGLAAPGGGQKKPAAAALDPRAVFARRADARAARH